MIRVITVIDYNVLYINSIKLHETSKSNVIMEKVVYGIAWAYDLAEVTSPAFRQQCEGYTNCITKSIWKKMLWWQIAMLQVLVEDTKTREIADLDIWKWDLALNGALMCSYAHEGMQACQLLRGSEGMPIRKFSEIRTFWDWIWGDFW